MPRYNTKNYNLLQQNRRPQEVAELLFDIVCCVFCLYSIGVGLIKELRTHEVGIAELNNLSSSRLKLKKT
ncbi:hypothetical protein CMV_021572 [Castanea mollissima]|uniref:Uncharacterized protein n=1 Tax=Castanea mollissima TaxID=60419 RepID=A0A8J4QTU7_9ROSI|nr:hypothetical protein CMV_021572 [Castanea mollissima]